MSKKKRNKAKPHISPKGSVDDYKLSRAANWAQIWGLPIAVAGVAFTVIGIFVGLYIAQLQLRQNNTNPPFRETSIIFETQEADSTSTAAAISTQRASLEGTESISADATRTALDSNASIAQATDVARQTQEQPLRETSTAWAATQTAVASDTKSTTNPTKTPQPTTPPTITISPPSAPAPTSTSAPQPPTSNPPTATSIPPSPQPPTSNPPTATSIPPSPTNIPPSPTPTNIPPSNTPLPPTQTPSPTETNPPAFSFNWDTQITCAYIENRVNNLNSVEVQVTGFISAKPDNGDEKTISEVPPPYQNCPSGGWCGPIEDIHNHYTNFQGVVWGTTWVHYQGVEVASKSFGPTALSCSP